MNFHKNQLILLYNIYSNYNIIFINITQIYLQYIYIIILINF